MRFQLVNVRLTIDRSRLFNHLQWLNRPTANRNRIAATNAGDGAPPLAAPVRSFASALRCARTRRIRFVTNRMYPDVGNLKRYAAARL